jgi:ectoine hydroxylase-related dioxygenase (phytanoyl-CoA dioxygenase family)
MVQYFQHPAFEANRRSARLHKAFAQLWVTADLWVTTDRVGFNAPERPDARFRGPDLHWDASVKTPIPFGTQGILYLADTAPEQGAFTLVPGFHRWGEEWLKQLPPGADPRRQNLHALGSQPIGGRAGDLIIWHQALPHGASANRASRPRLVQYINMFPAKRAEHEEWI